MDVPTLRSLYSPRQVALHLRDLFQSFDTRDLTSQLLLAIESESLAPDVFVIWLSVARSNFVTLAGIKQTFSESIRRSAISDFGRILRGPRWKTLWIDVGDTSGLLELLEHLPVEDVGSLCKAIGRAGRSGKDVDERREKVTELIHALFPQSYPDSPQQTTDRRPLSKYYAALVPACTSEYVLEVIRENGHPLPSYWSLPSSSITLNHWRTLRQAVLDLIEDPQHPDWDLDAIENFFKFHVSPLLLHIPKEKSGELGFSKPMSFSVEVLEGLIKNPKAKIGTRTVIHGLVDPLIRRMRKRRSQLRTQEVLDLAIAYLRRHPGQVTTGGWTGSELPTFLTELWCQDSPTFETILISYLKLHHLELQSIGNVFYQTDEVHRYALLRLIFKHSITDGRIDIEREDELRTAQVKSWPPKLFQALPVGDAVRLLQRLIRITPDLKIMEARNNWEIRQERTILSLALDADSHYMDPIIWLIQMGNYDGEISEKGQEGVKVNMEKSAKSRDPTDRAKYAKTAALYAIATGSLERYEMVVKWTKRFLRDQSSIPVVFADDAVCTKEGVALLSGIPPKLNELSIGDVGKRVRKGNEIVMQLFEFVLIALREQSFASHQWSGPLQLFKHVVLARMAQSIRLRDWYKLSREQMYQVLWQPCLDILLHAENLALEPGHEALEFDQPQGVLGFRAFEFAIGNQPCPSACRFLDDLAKNRDDIWQSVRRRTFPATAALPPPWPRGLPIQAFSIPRLGFDGSSVDDYPFLSARAKSVLQVEHNPPVNEELLDDEMRQAIGDFVDDYETALRFFVMHQKTLIEKRDQAWSAWNQAMKTSFSRMNLAETIAFLKPVFSRALPDWIQNESRSAEKESQEHMFPRIPDATDDFERTEWNPLDDQPRKVESRKLDATFLDCMLLVNKRGAQLKNMQKLAIPHPITATSNPPSIWSIKTLKKNIKADYRVFDGRIATAMLLLDSRLPGSARLLISPHPSATDVRFPSLFLDQEFLEANKNESEISATKLLGLCIQRVPPKLLHQLTKNALDDLAATPSDSTEMSTRQRIAYYLLQLLSQSDQPELAPQYIFETVIQNPDASSWHRFLLTQKFLRRLSPPLAKQFLAQFVTAIQRKLHPIPTAAQEKSSQQPAIKVTTIKYLAQILESTEVISMADTIKTLGDLFRTSSQIDVRVAVVAGLLTKLSECKDETSRDVAEDIISTLELTIPVIAGVSERFNMGERDWVESERTGELPEVDECNFPSLGPPILDAIYRSYAQFSTPVEEHRKALFSRVLLPAIRLSVQNHTRWTNLFVAKYGPQRISTSLPAIPVRPTLVAALLRSRFEEMPSELLELYQRHVLINLNPTSQLQALIQAIKDDPELQIANSGKHFLRQFDFGTKKSAVYDFVPASVLKGKWRTGQAILPELPVITPAQIKECIVGQASAILSSVLFREPHFKIWISFLAHLKAPLAAKPDPEAVNMWNTHGKSCIEAIIELVAPSSSHDDSQMTTMSASLLYDRQRPCLPELSMLRLWISIQWPALCTGYSGKDRARRLCAAGLIEVVREYAALGLSAHKRFQDLIDLVREWCTQTTEDRIAVAEHLGDIVRHHPHRSRSSGGAASRPGDVVDSAMAMDVDNNSSAEGTDKTLSLLTDNEAILRVELADSLISGLARPRVSLYRDSGTLTRVVDLVKGWLDCDIDAIRRIGWIRGADEELLDRLLASESSSKKRLNSA